MARPTKEHSVEGKALEATPPVAEKKQRKKQTLAFPVLPFEQPLDLARQLFRVGAGQPVRRLTLFDAINKAPESGASRTLIRVAVRYQLIAGSAEAETLELTEAGRKIVDETFSPRDRALASVDAAIMSVPVFSDMYSRFRGSKLPSKPVLIDTIQEFGIEKEQAEQGVDIFLENLQFVGLLQTLSGAERVISEDHLVETLSKSTPAQQPQASPASVISPQQVFSPPITSSQASMETTAFYVTPIGAEGSIQRKHSDLFLNTLIEPAAEKFGLRVVRADAIDKPGVITRQVMQYLVEARLVVADLSYHNPNVFYELAVRHMVRKPVVQIIQKSDMIPFDVNQLRTVVIDNTDIYTWTPRLEVWRSEISNQIRQALDDPMSSESPVNWYFSQTGRQEA